ncbi:MAG TPA: hypothetical protein VK017_06875 [Sphingobacterium sp.]|nr:hypothetical protein [Sphingobacterium sp.]
MLHVDETSAVGAICFPTANLSHDTRVPARQKATNRQNGFIRHFGGRQVQVDYDKVQTKRGQLMLSAIKIILQMMNNRVERTHLYDKN